MKKIIKKKKLKKDPECIGARQSSLVQTLKLDTCVSGAQEW